MTDGTRDTVTIEWTSEDAARVRAYCQPSERVRLHLEARKALRDVRLRVAAAADRLDGLADRLAAGTLDDADASLVADCVTTTTLWQMVEQMDELDPFPEIVSMGLVSLNCEDVPAFGRSDVPRLQAIADKLRGKA